VSECALARSLRSLFHANIGGENCVKYEIKPIQAACCIGFTLRTLRCGHASQIATKDYRFGYALLRDLIEFLCLPGLVIQFSTGLSIVRRKEKEIYYTQAKL
jgi:hypothetical protein